MCFAIFIKIKISALVRAHVIYADLHTKNINTNVCGFDLLTCIALKCDLRLLEVIGFIFLVFHIDNSIMDISFIRADEVQHHLHTEVSAISSHWHRFYSSVHYFESLKLLNAIHFYCINGKSSIGSIK